MVAKKKTRVTKRNVAPQIVEEAIYEEVRTSRRPSVLARALPFVYVALLVGAFFTGTLWQKVQDLETIMKNGAPTAGTQQPTQATPAPVTMDQIKNLFSQDLIKFGDATRKLLVVAVEDPSCPYCHIASGDDPELNKQSGNQFLLVSQGGTYVAPMKELKKLVDQGKASMVYIYTPGHGNGEMGQKALYCAFEKGKFWQAHDLLYSNAAYNLLNNTIQNDKAKSGQLADFLKSVVPAAEMKACLDSGKYDDRLNTDSAVAQSLGVTGTPGFFLNTTRFAGAYSFTEMQSAVDEALGK